MSRQFDEHQSGITGGYGFDEGEAILVLREQFFDENSICNNHKIKDCKNCTDEIGILKWDLMADEG